MSKLVGINGKFLSATPTGVHRVAEELIRALDRRLVADAALRRELDVELLVPPDARRELPLESIRTRTVGPLTRRAWEQLTLPRSARGRLLVNLCNIGPVLHRSSVTMIHDAQVRTHPESYSRAFRGWYQLVQPSIARRHLRVLTVSEFSKGELVRTGLCAPDRVTVVHNGVDHMHRVDPDGAAVERAALPRHGYAVALATTQAHKNIELLVRAFADPALADVPLALFGSTPREELESAFGALPDNVTLLGRVSDAELRGLLEGAACLAFPSRTEGFGLPPLEAMAVGCPVVAAPCGALPEVCGDAAVWADADDPDAWVRAVRRLRDDAAHRRETVRRGTSRAERFTWAAAADRLVEVIRDPREG